LQNGTCRNPGPPQPACPLDRTAPGAPHRRREADVPWPARCRRFRRRQARYDQSRCPS